MTLYIWSSGANKSVKEDLTITEDCLRALDDHEFLPKQNLKEKAFLETIDTEEVKYTELMLSDNTITNKSMQTNERVDVGINTEPRSFNKVLLFEA